MDIDRGKNLLSSNFCSPDLRRNSYPVSKIDSQDNNKEDPEDHLTEMKFWQQKRRSNSSFKATRTNNGSLANSASIDIEGHKINTRPDRLNIPSRSQNSSLPDTPSPLTMVPIGQDDDEDDEDLPQDNFYPIFLPIDRNYETKYLFHYRYHLKRRGKSMQERIYVFLEHPVGWGCFIYHMSV